MNNGVRFLLNNYHIKSYNFIILQAIWNFHTNYKIRSLESEEESKLSKYVQRTVTKNVDMREECKKSSNLTGKSKKEKFPA